MSTCRSLSLSHVLGSEPQKNAKALILNSGLLLLLGTARTTPLLLLLLQLPLPSPCHLIAPQPCLKLHSAAALGLNPHAASEPVGVGLREKEHSMGPTRVDLLEDSCRGGGFITILVVDIGCWVTGLFTGLLIMVHVVF